MWIVVQQPAQKEAPWTLALTMTRRVEASALPQHAITRRAPKGTPLAGPTRPALAAHKRRTPAALPSAPCTARRRTARQNGQTLSVNTPRKHPCKRRPLIKAPSIRVPPLASTKTSASRLLALTNAGAAWDRGIRPTAGAPTATQGLAGHAYRVKMTQPSATASITRTAHHAEVEQAPPLRSAAAMPLSLIRLRTAQPHLLPHQMGIATFRRVRKVGVAPKQTGNPTVFAVSVGKARRVIVTGLLARPLAAEAIHMCVQTASLRATAP